MIKAGEKEGGMTQEFGIRMLRTNIEGQTEEHIKGIIEDLLTKLSVGILAEAMRFKQKWEEETLREGKFFAGDDNGKTH